ncbi:MAG: helix-turn-helix domain-containing protein [Clostridium sp.]
MENKTYKNEEHLIYLNLIDYLKNKNEEYLVKLYNLLEKDLFRVLNHPFYLLPEVIKNQRKSRFAATEDKLNKNNTSNHKRKINNNMFFETYKKRFLDDICSMYYYESTFVKHSLLSPFWEVLNGMNLEKVDFVIKKYNFTYKNYLILKFSDYYWSYLLKKLTTDYVSGITSVSSINEIENKTNNEGDSYFFDIFQYKNNIYTNLETSIFYNEYLKLFTPKSLSKSQKTILHLILKGYTNKEISNILNISQSTIRNQQKRIIAKGTTLKINKDLYFN